MNVPIYKIGHPNKIKKLTKFYNLLLLSIIVIVDADDMAIRKLRNSSVFLFFK